jgi:AraC-like DNA-binding protein
VINIDYNLINFDDLLRQYAKCLQLKPVDNGIAFSPEKGTGTIRALNLPNDLQVMVYDYTTFGDLLFHRNKNDKEFYILRLDEATGLDGITRSSVFFSRASQEWFYMATARNHLKHVDILIKKEWLDTYFEDEMAGEALSGNIALKSPLLIYEVMDVEYKRLMQELMQNNLDKCFEKMYVQNRVLLLLERFFTRLYRKTENEHGGVKISAYELRSLKEIEALLLKDFSEPPPAIVQLARMAAMSTSKLKILFKDVYHMPINQYYQKHRMNKAKAMLISKKHTVRETAYALGFSTVSSFNKSFLKAFDQLPADIAVTDK